MGTSALAGDNLTVDLHTVIQKNFLGINAVYHAFTYMPESVEQGMTDKLRPVEFSRVKASGLHIARSFYRPDWAMGDGAWSLPDWESAKMRALYRWLSAMQKMHVDVGLNMGWWFGRDVVWNRDQHLPSYPDDMRHYAAWVSESLHQIIRVRGFTNVKYIFMFTEPGDNYGDIPAGQKVWPYYKEVLHAVQNRLVADGLRGLVKIVAPDTTQAPRWVAKAAAELNDVVDIYTSHNYNFKSYRQWFDMAVKVRKAAKSSGKPFWIDEYGVQNPALRRSPVYGNILAQANAAFLNAGAQSSLLWIFNDQYYPYPLKYISNGDAFVDGLHKWGLFPWLPESKGLRPSWYAFTMLSRLMGGGRGTKVYGTSGQPDLYVAATGLPGGDLSVMLVNGADYSRQFNLLVNGSFAKPLYHYIYDPARPPITTEHNVILSDRRAGLVDHRLNGSLPARAVVIYSSLQLAADSNPGHEIISAAEGNLAQGRIASASSSAADHPPGNVTDGRRLLYWSSQRRAKNREEYITVDLGRGYMLNHVGIYPRSDRKNQIGAGFPVDYALEISEDGKSWHPVAAAHEIRQPGAAVRMIRFPARLARYIRFRGLKLRRTDKQYYVMQVGEIKAYAAD